MQLHASWSDVPLGGDCAHLNRLAEETFFLQLGLYLILFPSLGAMLLPLCIIVPAHTIR